MPVVSHTLAYISLNDVASDKSWAFQSTSGDNLVRSAIAQRVFGTREVLIAAKQLLMLPGIDVATDVPAVDYFHMLFDRHEVVISNGAETESLYTGAQALKALSAEAVNEIFTIFPELRDENMTREGARLLTTGRQGRKLASRHLQNHKPLVC